jgi:hypothetical protein
MGVLYYVTGTRKPMRTQLNTLDEQTLFVDEYAANKTVFVIRNNERAERFRSQF